MAKSGPVNEDDLVTIFGSFKENEFKVVLFMNDKKVEIIDMPLLVAEIKKIEGASEKIGLILLSDFKESHSQ